MPNPPSSAQSPSVKQHGEGTPIRPGPPAGRFCALLSCRKRLYAKCAPQGRRGEASGLGGRTNGEALEGGGVAPVLGSVCQAGAADSERCRCRWAVAGAPPFGLAVRFTRVGLPRASKSAAQPNKCRRRPGAWPKGAGLRATSRGCQSPRGALR